MGKNFEALFHEEVRKRKQKGKKRMPLKVGVVLLILGIITGFIYLLHQADPILKIGNSSISPIPLFFTTIGLILIFTLVIYIIKHKSSINRHKPFLISLQFPWVNSPKKIKSKYLLGCTLLLIALIYQTNPSEFTNPINNAISYIVYKPKPPQVNSPWPWKGSTTIHPLVTNMPFSAKKNIKSVAKYIFQNESNQYLRIKALHDFVISWVTYDQEVITTGRRPPQDAQTVFQTRKGVCEGYALLFMALGKTIGTDVVYIEGIIRRDLAPINLIPMELRILRPDDYWTRHAWNAVKIADDWQLVDTTWDDGSSYKTDYLMPPPKAMIISHFPDYLNWQLLYPFQNKANFEKQPFLAPQFFVE